MRFCWLFFFFFLNSGRFSALIRHVGASGRGNSLPPSLFCSGAAALSHLGEGREAPVHVGLPFPVRPLGCLSPLAAS